MATRVFVQNINKFILVLFLSDYCSYGLCAKTTPPPPPHPLLARPKTTSIH